MTEDRGKWISEDAVNVVNRKIYIYKKSTRVGVQSASLDQSPDTLYVHKNFEDMSWLNVTELHHIHLMSKRYLLML
jgi:hypothetical protein